MSLEDHAEELASDLGVDKKEVHADLEKLVAYSVPMDEAKQSLRRKYGDGGGGSSSGDPKPVAIGDVTTADSTVTVTGRILTVGQRSIRYQGDEQVIYEGAIADETGRISYTAWEDFGLSEGDTITAGNAGVREWEGGPELNFGSTTTIRFDDDPLEVPYDVGGDKSLAEVETGDRGINIEVVVHDVETKTIDGRDGETEILSGVLADETTRLPFTDWDPHDQLEPDATVRIENAYVREFRGVPAVNISEFSTVDRIERTIDVNDEAQGLPIGEAIACGGVFDLEVAGSVVAVRDGSGLIQRCPECSRVIQKGQCRSHGDVEGVDDLRTKAILDDGTGAVTVVLDDEQTGEVYGGDLEAARDHAREEMDQSVVEDQIRQTIVGREFRARGSLSVDEYGANLDAAEFAVVTDDPADRARATLAEVAE